ncbi:unnamed protein product [Durusdinium trenchii]|uniref:R3H domain-containing protein n=2 Tax=Durusdinium trenchii TaxID=1381693 RepID=A0ABP0JI44_9DINO
MTGPVANTAEQMAEAMDTVAAFPDAWDAKGKGVKGGKGKRQQHGDQGRKGKGGKGGGKGGKGGKNGGKEELPTERKDELEAQLIALSRGTESSATPRVGDLVEVKVLGSDPQELQGQMGPVLGIASLPSLATPAITVRLPSGETSVSASELRIVEAQRPLPEGSLSFPKSLTGMERKFVHSVCERLGLISQSFGKGDDRYITAFRPAEGSGSSGCEPSAPSPCSPSTTVIDVSGVKLDDESKRALLDAVVVPEGWVSSAERMVVCHGSFQKPKQMDHRSVVPDLLNEIATLRPGSTASLRVVTVARGENTIAVGVLGVPSADRNPHVLVATSPGAHAVVKDLHWKPWSPS